MPWEFNKVYIVKVYTPLDTIYHNARDNLLYYLNLLENKSPDSAKIVHGDFNKANIRGFILNYMFSI